MAENNSGITTVRHTAVATVVGVTASRNTVCKDSSLTLSVNDSTAGTSITWDGLTDKTASIKVTPNATTTYKVSITKSGAKVEDTVTVSVLETPKVFAKDTAICANLSVELSNKAFSKIIWNNATSTATYIAKADETVAVKAWVDESCPVLESTIKVSSKAIPVTGLPKTLSLCDGAKDTLVAKGGVTYEWNKATVKVDSLFVNESGTYIVTVTNANKCQTIDTIEVKVGKKPNITVFASKTSVCRGENVTLTSQGAETYIWSNAIVNGKAFNLTQTTTFTVTGADNNGCESTTQTTISVKLPYHEQLGLVTYDSATGKKLIVAWTPTKKQGTSAYVLYRLNDKTAKFDSLKRFSPTDSSCFVDAIVQPLAQSYTYKLVTRDSVCNDTVESRAHTSVRLTASLSTDVQPKANLSWNLYGGMDVEKYHVLVYDADNKLIETVDRVNGPNDLVLLDYSYDKHKNGNKYRIAFDLPSQVVVSRLKTDSGPFSQSLSNMSEASLVDEAVLAVDAELTASPNPVKDVLTIRAQSLELSSAVTFIDSKGASISVPVLTSSSKEVSVSVAGLNDGIYTIMLVTARKTATVTVQVIK